MNHDDAQTTASGLEGVVGRGRRIRRIRGRRRALATVLATGAAALVAAVAVAVPSTGHPGAVRDGAAGGHAVNVDLAGFSVHTNPDATVTVDITPTRLVDADQLRSALAEAGVPAEVRTAVFTDGLYSCQPTPGLVNLPETETVFGLDDYGRGAADPGRYAYRIKPSAMPSGSVLTFDVITATTGGPTSKATIVQTALNNGRPGKCVEDHAHDPNAR